MTGPWLRPGPFPVPAAAGFKLVHAQDPSPVQRIIIWKGIAVDVRCVTRVEIISAEEMAEEFRTSGRGLQYSDADVAVVRYENSEASGGLFVEVLSPEANAQLVERFTREIEYGNAPRLDLHNIQWELEVAFQIQRLAPKT